MSIFVLSRPSDADRENESIHGSKANRSNKWVMSMNHAEHIHSPSLFSLSSLFQISAFEDDAVSDLLVRFFISLQTFRRRSFPRFCIAGVDHERWKGYDEPIRSASYSYFPASHCFVCRK